jgi:hypothetical protein
MENIKLLKEINNTNNEFYFIDLDIRIKRIKKMINWMIDGQFQHGI